MKPLVVILILLSYRSASSEFIHKIEKDYLTNLNKLRDYVQQNERDAMVILLNENHFKGVKCSFCLSPTLSGLPTENICKTCGVKHRHGSINLRHVEKQMGVSAKQLAKLLGIKESSLNAYKSNLRPSRKCIIRLKKILREHYQSKETMDAYYNQ